ncbi:MAG: hypothetical protein JNM56_11975 [Planctomycetia bacterium]|nr:hypothetical protein [Planctomycetia bacterium]
MIEVPRSTLREFRQVLRRTLPARPTRDRLPWVVVEAGTDRLTLRTQHTDAALTLQLPVRLPPQQLALPAQALDALEGRQGTVQVDADGQVQVQARWEEAGVPRVVDFATIDVDQLPPFPPLPKEWATNPPGFLAALHDAMQSAARESVRYALGKVQLRGSGEIAATDGKQLLLQAGFRFPWKGNVLVPKVGLFGGLQLPQDVGVQVGRTEKHVVVQAGPWTVHLSADQEGRFPAVETIVPHTCKTTWKLSPAEAKFLRATLAKLPGASDAERPLTVDLNGKAVLRVHGAGQNRPTEVILEQSQVNGPPVRCCVNRELLGRALELGFMEVRVVNADQPLWCQDGPRRFVFMPLPAKESLAPHPDALRISSATTRPVLATSPGTKGKPMPKPHGPLPPPTPSAVARPPAVQLATNENEPLAAVEEAVALQTMLRDALTRVNALVVALRQQQRERRLFQHALGSLRRLQQM